MNRFSTISRDIYKNLPAYELRRLEIFRSWIRVTFSSYRFLKFLKLLVHLANMYIEASLESV